MNDLINAFFKEINNYGIKYAILHHLENIYSKNNDIDIVVNANKKEMLDFLKFFIAHYNCYLVKYYTIDRDTYRFDIFYFKKNNLEKIELDCVCKGKGKDLLQLNSNKLLKNRIKVFFKGNEFYKITYRDEIKYYIKKKAHKNEDITIYINYLKKLDNSLSEKIIQKRYQYWKKYFISKQYKIKYLFNKIHLLKNRCFEQTSLSISILGPDGSGKSTIINEIKNANIFINTYYFHLKPIKTKKSLDVIVTDPHKFPPYSQAKSYIKLLYFVYQYSFGWLKNIIKLKIKSSLIIFDRYFDDILVDNKRYRYGGSLVVAKLARFFIPKPDLYFILTTDAKVIYERKQEVPFEELERQIKEYKALADGKRYFNIDVNRTPEEIGKEIILIIMEKMNEKY